MVHPKVFFLFWQVWLSAFAPPAKPAEKKKRFEDGGECKGPRVQL